MQTRLAVIDTTAAVGQKLPEKAASVVSVIGLAGGAATVAAERYTIKTSAPAASTDVQFVGTPNAPDDNLTFDAALAANGVLFVTYVPQGGIPASE